MAVNLYNKEQRIKYSQLYFEALSMAVPYETFVELLKLERQDERKPLHTFEYWWIKYKMVKNFDVYYESKEDFERSKKKYKLDEAFAKRVYEKFVKDYPEAINYSKIYINLFKEISLNFTVQGSKLICISNNYPYIPEVYYLIRKERLKKELDDLILETRKAQNEDSSTILCLANYLSTNELKNIPDNDASQSILAKFKKESDSENVIKELQRDLFIRHYKSKKVKFDFDEIYEKYGDALFDIFYAKGLGMRYYSEKPNDSFYISCAIKMLISYFVNEIIQSIRKYEAIFGAQIIVNSPGYWDYVGNKLNEFAEKRDKEALEDKWWTHSCDLTSKISLVPDEIFENMTKDIVCIFID